MNNILHQYKNLYWDIYAAMLSQYRTENIVDALKIRRDRLTRYVASPDDKYLSEHIKKECISTFEEVANLDL